MDYKKWFGFFFTLIFFGTISVAYFRDLADQPMHIDEHEWVRRGAYFYEKFFIDNDYSYDIWSTAQAIDQPKVGEYLFGWWLRVSYSQDLDELLAKTNYNQGWAENDDPQLLWSADKWWIGFANRKNQDSAIPPEHVDAYQILVQSRRLTGFFGLMTLGLLFYLVWKIRGYAVATLAVFFLAVNPFFYRVSRLALLDSFFVFFLLLAVFMSLTYFQKRKHLSGRKLLYWEVMMAITLVLGASIKLNGLMVLVCFPITIASAYLLSPKKESGWRLFLSVSRVIVISVMIYICLHPMLWRHPIESLGSMYAQRVSTTQGHLVNFPHSVRKTLLSKMDAIVWIGLGGRRGYVDVVMLALTTAGLVSLCRRYRETTSLFIVSWYGTVFLFMSWYLSLSWYWHYAIIMPFLSLLPAVGLMSLYNLAKRYFYKLYD